MKCREFQKNIPAIIKKNISIKDVGDIIEHLENCKECYDELEIHYIIQYGLNENNEDASMNFIGQLEENLNNMKRRFNMFETANAIYALTQIMAYTAIGGAFIYVLFNYFL